MQVIFPMAGLGSRFGYEFKPFIKATEATFIETAKEPFDKLDEPNFVFTFRHSQEKQYQVSSRIKSLFGKDNVHCHMIKSSDGPLQTLQMTVRELDLEGPTFVCDCDHRVDITPIMKKYNEIKLSCKDFIIIPTWVIKESEYQHWGKVRLDDSGSINAFCEKEYLDNQNGIVKGMIGCYLFSNIEKVLEYAESHENISDILKIMLYEGYNLITVDIEHADFFGVPEALQAYRFSRAKKYTLFVDIDGTLIHQTTRELLPGTIEKLHEWIEHGHKIILTTATPDDRHAELYSLLYKYQIPFDNFIGNLTPGPRIVINDKKPYLPYYCMADGIMLDRNSGIENVELAKECPSIIKEFSGASFAQVFLVQGEDELPFVRKYISKIDKSLDIHVDKLKRQLEDLKRFDFMKQGIVPKILGSYESPNEFYYDIEYLQDFQTLSTFDKLTINQVVFSIFATLHVYVYCYQRKISINKREDWLKTFLSTKVYPKFQCVPEKYNHFIFGNVIINNVGYPSIDEYLTKIEHHLFKLAPEVECPIHGDFTLENIMYNPMYNEFKLIDNEGSRYYDAIEMDLGKLFQSMVCEYSIWKDSCEDVLTIVDDSSFVIHERFLDIASKKPTTILRMFGEDTDAWFLKGIFYMTTYFIRMIPFMLNKSPKHFMFTLLMCRVYLKYVVDNLEYPQKNDIEIKLCS